MKKAAIWIGVIIAIIVISFFFGAYLGNRYKSDYTQENSKKIDIKKVMENKDTNSTNSNNVNNTNVEDSNLDSQNNSNSSNNNTSANTNTNTNVDNTNTTNTNTQTTSQSEDESKTIYRIIVDGQQKVALTGKQKAIDYAKKNFKGNVVIQSSKTNETVAEFRVE